MSEDAPVADDEATGVDQEVRRAVEAILMVAVDPVPANLLAQLLEVSTASIEEVCANLADEFEGQRRGFTLVRVGGGYRFQSHPDQAPWVERFVVDGQSSRLTAAALETLAIVAYKQPVSRAQLSAIRGVDVETVVRTLQQRGYIGEVTRDSGPGNAILYGTTREFLERMGLDDIGQLSPLGEFVPGPEVVEALERGLRSDPEVEETVAMVADGSAEGALADAEGALADADGAAAPEG